MNKYYAKAVLYAYKHLEDVMEQIDELVEKKALSSINDLSPCVCQCEKILSYTEQKDTLIVLKIIVDKVLEKFSNEELVYFSYKYFRDKEKDCFRDFDYTGRAYFRKQVKLAEKFADKLEKSGVNDEWFEEYCLKMDFFKELLKRVYELEDKTLKNRSKRKVSDRREREYKTA